MKTYSLAPVDAWFFRDGRPYNEKEANQADVVSVFPPPARTLSGALRAALARANGWTGRGSWPQPLNRAFGSGPEELGGLQFTGPFLILNDEALWPLPRHVLGSVGGGENWEPRALLRPAEAPTACDAGDIRLPEIVATKGTRPDGLKNAETAWITAKGLGALLAGELPEVRSIVQVKKLWAHEARVGLHRDEKTLVTGEGALYSPSYVRLRRGVALGVGVAGVPEGMAHVPDIFPLGGESRLACCEAWNHDAIPSPPSREKFAAEEGRVAFIVVMLTPGRFENGALKLPLPGAKIISACVGKPQFIGGWDSLKREPLPLEPFAPAGAVWFCAATREDFDDIYRCHGRQMGAHTAHGFGQIAIGLWPPTPANNL
jgi:CRISPR-associated protein Cmr3